MFLYKKRFKFLSRLKCIYTEMILKILFFNYLFYLCLFGAVTLLKSFEMDFFYLKCLLWDCTLLSSKIFVKANKIVEVSLSDAPEQPNLRKTKDL